jgi:hypothetical protein
LIFTTFPKVLSVDFSLNSPLYTTFLLFTPLLPTFFPLPPLSAPPREKVKKAQKTDLPGGRSVFDSVIY